MFIVKQRAAGALAALAVSAALALISSVFDQVSESEIQPTVRSSAVPTPDQPYGWVYGRKASDT